jgi:hypothetical protein
VLRQVAAVVLALSAAGSLRAEEFRLEDVASVTDVAQLKPKTIAFTDHRTDELADPFTGLIRFEDWARARPLQKQWLSLYPSYVEPTVNITLNGITKPRLEKLHVYVAEARFMLSKPATAVDLSRFASLQFLTKADPAIKHRPITPADLMPYKEPRFEPNRHPQRHWCEGNGRPVCIGSRYELEGKIPLGIRLVNKLEEGRKPVAESIEFQSELRLLPPEEIDQAGIAKLTGVGAPIAGALEENIFYVNQMMQFGKLLAVVQQHPTDAGKSIATTFVALAIKTDVLERKKEFEKVPVLRNLVPAQVLMGKSSFNSGNSLSAGVPEYARNRIKAIAGILDAE